jgi:hypothetical protein
MDPSPQRQVTTDIPAVSVSSSSSADESHTEATRVSSSAGGFGS